MAKWLIDCGHGGSDPGATYKGRKESDDTLRLGIEIGNILALNNEKVNYTRLTDSTVSLQDRSSMENNGDYDYFISIHRNAFKPEEAKGVEAHIYNNSGKKKDLAQKIVNGISNLGFVNRGIKISNFHVLRETKCPAILVEVGFIDNANDNKTFDSSFYNIANSISKACLEVVGKTISIPPEKPLTEAGNQFYRVVCGSFSNKNNAEIRKRELETLGYKDVFLDVFKK